MRSVLKHLLEAATCEFLFTQDFFKARGLETFNAIFARTLSLCLENLENYLFNCYDAIGLLLMIKITIAFRQVMQRRRIAVLDSFFDRITMLLWPRCVWRAPWCAGLGAPDCGLSICHAVTSRP